MVYVWQSLIHFGFTVSFAQFYCLVSFPHVVVKGTYIELVASMFVAHDSLVLVWMIESFNCGVTLITFQTFRTLVPS